MALHLRFHDIKLSVCQMEPQARVTADMLMGPFWGLIHVPGETTLVCSTAMVPAGMKSEPGWIAMELVGPFDFSLTGILTKVAVPLAEVGVAIYALSTFNTDYVLIKEEKCEIARAALIKAGHSFL